MLIYRKHIPEKKNKFLITDKNGKIIKDKKILSYVESLVIPPAYKDVKIFMEKSPKILFEGFDDKDRLQQIYSAAHRKKGDKKKFANLVKFGRTLPKIMADVYKHIKGSKLTKEKIISLNCFFKISFVL